jgi:MFS family permease
MLARALPRTVWVLAAVALLNDAASEMIAPLLPLFLTLTLGAGPAVVGLVEGAAEAAASLLKLASGRIADRGVDRRKLVIAGYALANVARPLIGVAATWTQVLALRVVDRIGKGIRTAPRDALLAASVGPQARGRAFGVHRSADHLGAMVGPLLATVFLAAGFSMRQVFLVAGALGAVTIVTLVIGLAKADVPVQVPVRTAPLIWRGLDSRLRAFLIAAGVVAAATVPEALLVLWAMQHGVALAWIPILWAAAHALKALLAWPCGELVDRIGPLPVLVFGWPLRVAALLALASVAPSGALVWVLFVAYAATLAVTEAAERSLVAAAAPEAARGTAFGWFHLFAGVGALPGAWLIGTLWESQGFRTALLAAAVIGAIASAAAGVLAMRSRAVFTARSAQES